MYVKQGIATTTVGVTMFPMRRRRRVVDRGVREENGEFVNPTFLLGTGLSFFILNKKDEKRAFTRLPGREWGKTVSSLSNHSAFLTIPVFRFSFGGMRKGH
jgi:hypothetical protein